MSKLIDLTGQTINEWQVLSRGNNDKNGRARWNCKCLLCGTIKEVDGSHLRSGRSKNCGCQKIKKMTDKLIINEINNKYGKLTVIEQAATPKNKKGIYWKCQCECGNTIIVKGDYLRNGDTKSCGCLNSQNESLIANLLDNNNILYIKQFWFKDLKSINKDYLFFDFAILDSNNNLLYLIEYDGIQHFQKGHFKDTFFTTRKNDLLKNQYCFNNNIPLIRIPYNCNYTLEDLILLTSKFILTPENEEEYYNR